MTKRTKKRARPASHLDTVATDREAARAAPPAPTPRPPTMAKAVKATFYLPAELMNELRAASRWLAGPPLFVAGVSELVQQAVSEKLEALARTHNAREPFAGRAPTTARRGRPGKRHG